MISRRGFLASAAAAGLAGAGCTVRPRPPAPPGGKVGGADTTVPPTQAAGRALVHGVATPSIEAMYAFETAAGRYVRSFTSYRSWGAPDVNLDWERDLMRRLVGRGTTPVLTFQPQVPGGSVNQPAFSHARICAGDFDDLLTRWGATLAAVGGPVTVRPMHEGNGTWYPWCAGVNGNTAASYVAAWRHIHDVVSAAGAADVRWMWSMNKVYVGASAPLAALYPGDDVVDDVAFSGYNGGTAVDRAGWRDVRTIFDASLDEAHRLCDKPLRIAETGCVEQGGDKAAWIADLWAWLAERTDIAAVTWFDFAVGAADWRVATSTAAQAAYRRGAIDTIASRL